MRSGLLSPGQVENYSSGIEVDLKLVNRNHKYKLLTRQNFTQSSIVNRATHSHTTNSVTAVYIDKEVPFISFHKKFQRLGQGNILSVIPFLRNYFLPNKQHHIQKIFGTITLKEKCFAKSPHRIQL